ncbi:uncharacterized protein LOC120126395 [Hibiscus syriacus]|uniref:uncharacterized protein LOC120126395 n=1 Tax=Hibiscus syriacus TaxID=106335 RepID=UPI0019219BC3|nr:uncharacterized protein LOC120126395 [Hibiscus syriacus]
MKMQRTALTRRSFKLAAAARRKCRTSSKGNPNKATTVNTAITIIDKKRSRSIKSLIRRLRLEMKERDEEQRKIKEGQRQVKERSEAIEVECEELRKEALLITQQSASTQMRLALMFQILKARENLEFDKAAICSLALRGLVERENQRRKL